jgi:hypothetical protein
MNLLEEPSLQSGDNLDNLLRAFFQAEMPNPWPSMEAPAARLKVAPPRPTPQRKGSLLRSRLALAASVALLLSGPLFLSSALRDTSMPNLNVGGGNASTVDPVGPTKYKHQESLIQTPDGTGIQIDIFELPSSK